MPTDLSEICQQCKAKYEQSVANLLKINKDLEINNQLLQQEINQMVTAEPDNRDQLIDLIAEDIEWQEANRPNSPKFKPIIALYRTLRPKEKP